MFSGRVILALASVFATIACSLATFDHQSATTLSPYEAPIFREALNFTGQNAATSTTPRPVQSRGAENVKSKDGGPSHASVGASDRIMKELKAIYKSDSYKNGAIKIELEDGELYKWDVRMPVLDDECELYKSMQELRNIGKDDHIKFRIVFNDQYPEEPPLVRVIYPKLNPGRFNVRQGVPCMKILTKSGWNPGYSMEALMLTVVDGFVTASKISRVEVKGDNFDEKLTDEDAREILKDFAEFHNQVGWS